MSSGRRAAFAAVAMLVASGALVTMVLTVDQPRPVDARQVDRGPVAPGVLSATYTTTVEVVRSTTPVAVIASPGPRQAPPPPVTTPPVTTPPLTAAPVTPPPPTSVPPTTTTPSSARPSWEENCDRSYRTDGTCVPLRFPREVRRLCQWLLDHGVTRIEVLGRDRHHLDLDGDGVACERRD